MDLPLITPPFASGSLSWYGPSGPDVDCGGAASNTFTANAAIFLQTFTPVFATIAGFGWINGSAVSGNVDCGLYDQNGNRLGHTGSTAQAGTNAAQTAAPSGGSFDVPPGTYYVAIAIDNVTGTLQAQASSQPYLLQALGIFGMAAAFPLPTTATFAAPTQSRVPWCAAFTEGSTF